MGLYTSGHLAQTNYAGSDYPAPVGYTSTDLGIVQGIIDRVAALIYTQPMLTKYIKPNLMSERDNGMAKPGDSVIIPYVGSGTVGAVQTVSATDAVTLYKGNNNYVAIVLENMYATGISVQEINKVLSIDYQGYWDELKNQSIMPVLNKINTDITAQYANATNTIAATGTYAGGTYPKIDDIINAVTAIKSYEATYCDLNRISGILHPTAAAQHKIAGLTTAGSIPSIYQTYLNNQIQPVAGVNMVESLHVPYTTDIYGVKTYYNMIFAQDAIVYVARKCYEAMNNLGVVIETGGTDMIGFPFTMEKWLSTNPITQNLIFRVLMAVETLYPDQVCVITSTVNP